MHRYTNSFKSKSFFLRNILTVKSMFIVTCILTLLLYFILIITNDKTMIKSSENIININDQLKETDGIQVKWSQSLSGNSSTNLKYILIWAWFSWDNPFDAMETGQKAFFRNNCTQTNCYVTSDRNYFGGDLKKFDALAFHMLDLHYKLDYELPDPKSRLPHQKYIAFNMESPVNYPIHNSVYDGYFNWTATYKFESEIHLPYMQIRDRSGKVVGPKRFMEWKKDMNEEYEVPTSKIKAAAWFVSHCKTNSRREKYVTKLQSALEPYGLKVDVYGKCGPHKCLKNREEECLRELRRDYFFYMSMENSFAEDYVTEKVLHAVQRDTVPIVYGGANYSWFLPPGSYLDANKLSPDQLAATMHKLIKSPELYRQYFRWKHHYTYHNPIGTDNICAICTALNNKTMIAKQSSYENFIKWWNNGTWYVT